MSETLEDRISEIGEKALSVKENAHQPYSEYGVGAAISTSDHNLYKGCNVENATFTLTVHAEQNALTSAIADGHSEFEGLVIATHNIDGEPPCGVCRQTLAEFCEDDFFIASLCALDDTSRDNVDGLCEINGEEMGYNVWTLGTLFPEAFRVFET